MRRVPAASRRDGLRWWVARHRRGLAAASAAVAVWAGLAAARARPAATTTVLVASRDLAPGTHLAAADLRGVALPAAAVPPSALRPGAAAIGRRLAVAVPAGVPLTAASLSLGRILPAGTVATPVRLADPGETVLLHPGDRVDVLAAAGDALGGDALSGDAVSDGGPAPAGGAASTPPATGLASPPATASVTGAVATEIADDVPVLSVPTPAADDSGGLIVVAATPAQAALLARAAASERLSITVHPT